MADTWKEILGTRKKYADFKRSMEKKRLQRQKLLGNGEKGKEHHKGQTREIFMEIDPKLESQILECLLSPVLEMPIDPSQLAGKISKKPPQAKMVALVLEKMAAQELVQLQAGSNSLISLDIDRVTKVAEALGITGQLWVKPPTFANAQEEVEWLLNAPSVRDQETRRVGTEIQELLSAKTVKEQLMLEKFQSAGGSQLREFCPHKTREDCRRITGTRQGCDKLHFRKIIQAHTDESLGDCSFLNTCFHMETCKFVHYEIEQVALLPPPELRHAPKPSFTSASGSWINTGLKSIKLNPAQWINCDLRNFDMSVLGKFAVIMADPPWDIHMELPYGTMSDNEMRELNIPAIQDNGYIFLWVTGRAMELGRECLTLWGYERIGELIWVKTNQLQRLIRTGRTGHWINHGKEHCLIGVKGDLKDINRGIDCDVIVAEVRATSHKPDEVYGIIERLSPGTTKIELFGRQHNCQPNWLTLGNQLDGVRIHDPDMRERFYARYPSAEMAILPQSTPQLIQ